MNYGSPLCENRVKTRSRPYEIFNSEYFLSVSTKQRILAVDDEAGIRDLITDVLVLAGFEVQTAADGLVALDL